LKTKGLAVPASPEGIAVSLTPQQRGAMITNSGNSPLAKYDKKELTQTLLARYLDGEDMASLANEYGVTRKRLYQVLVEEDEEGWKTAQVAAAIDRLELAKGLIDTAQTALDLARARESAKTAQWELERTCKRIYGTDAPQLGGQGTININIGIKRDTPVSHVIDSVEVVPVSQTGKGEGGGE
jgi:hypothetical protein